jgi:ABC-type multidrug transport system fused ATPase/permease subunit
MRYRPELPLSLHNLDLHIEPGLKSALVGRTGAGKSSITVALFRLVELQAGRITIDGIDISTVGLRQLRRAMAAIQQEAILFSGTLRSNLDPLEQVI